MHAPSILMPSQDHASRLESSLAFLIETWRYIQTDWQFSSCPSLPSATPRCKGSKLVRPQTKASVGCTSSWLPTSHWFIPSADRRCRCDAVISVAFIPVEPLGAAAAGRRPATCSHPTPTIKVGSHTSLRQPNTRTCELKTTHEKEDCCANWTMPRESILLSRAARA